MIVGLAGYAQSGKDTAAAYLEEYHGFTRVAFADKLREAMIALDPWVKWGTTWVPWSEVVDTIGYERAKAETNGRELMQRLGTDVGRRLLSDDVWVTAAFMTLTDGKDYVFTDVRFPNEAAAIKRNHRFGLGEVWRIWRPGYGPVNDHPSEVALDSWPFDLELANDGTTVDLQHKLYAALHGARVGQ